MLTHPLANVGNVPMSAAAVASLFGNLRQKNEKVCALERANEIIRLKRGLYVANPQITGKALSVELIANHLYAPSYVSMHTALRYYGMIPEAVCLTQSMTVKHSRAFTTPLGQFAYYNISRKAFAVGVTSINHGDYTVLIATPEKALCDLVAHTAGVNLRYLEQTWEFLAQDLRLDMDQFKQMNPVLLEQYAAVGKKANSIKTIIRLLRNEQRN